QRTENREQKEVTHFVLYSLFFVLLRSPLGSEENFGGLPRRRLTAVGHRSLHASTRLLASSQPSVSY
ncbi:MAG: hypothetical protein ACJ8CR_28095, partial [Roseiflexaceae bacterium]